MYLIAPAKIEAMLKELKATKRRMTKAHRAGDRASWEHEAKTMLEQNRDIAQAITAHVLAAAELPTKKIQ